MPADLRIVAEARAQDPRLITHGIQRYGIDAQIDQVIEELAELIVALRHCRRGREGAVAEVLEETADVVICLGYVRAYVGSDAVDAAVLRKLARSERRMGLASEDDT